MTNCLQCNQTTNNPKFCNNQCSARYNNVLRPKKVRNKRQALSDKSIKELSALHNNKYKLRAYIRSNAASVFKKKGINNCEKCGYSKYIEYCHIQSVSSFNENCKISEVNNPNNLIGLCPNCHWLTDNPNCKTNVVKRGKDLRGDITLGESIYSCKYSNSYSLCRVRARIVILSNGLTSCKSCGFDKHIEACHIKPISSFPLDTKLSVINNLSNLIALCPNCHWEHDNL